MRVALSGGGGIGKTTFIEHISGSLQRYVVIPDFIDVILKERGLNSPRELDDKGAREVRLEALARKVESERSSEDFLSDKSVADYHAYWMIWTMGDATDEERDRFHEMVNDHIGIYDKVIIPPFGRFEIEDNNIRSTDRYHQYRVHTLIKGIYQENGVPFSEYALNLEDSAERVIEEVGIE
jgi:hypothetical protein